MEDRLTHETVGGPYASQDDATRAIERGGFSENAANLIVVPGGDDDDDDDDSKKTSSRTAALPEPPKAPGDDGDDHDFEKEDVGENDVTDQDQPPEVTGADPAQETGVFPTTTKPSQLPSGSGPLQQAQQPAGGQAMLPGGSALPAMPGSPQFAPGGMQQADVSGIDPVAQQIDSVAALVRQDNPSLSEDTIQRIARSTVGRYLAARPANPSLMPTIEDPLADKSPFSLTDTTQQADPTAGGTKTTAPDSTGSGNVGGQARNTAETAGGAAAGRAVMRVLPMLAV